MALCVCRNLNKQSGACQRKYFEPDHPEWFWNHFLWKTADREDTISGSDKDLNADRRCFAVDALFYLLYSWHCPFKEMLFVLSCYCDLIVHPVPVKKFCFYSPSRSPSKCCAFFPEELFFWEEEFFRVELFFDKAFFCAVERLLVEELFCVVVLPFWEELFCAEDFFLVEAAFCCLSGDGVKVTFGGLLVVRVCTEAESRWLSGARECEKAVPERLSGTGECEKAVPERLSGAGECEKAASERLSGPGVPAGAA